MKTVLILIGLIFAVFGFGEFLHVLKLYFIFPKRKLWSHLVVNLQNDIAEAQVAYVCEQFLWYGSAYADFLVFNGSELSEENFKKADIVAGKYGFSTKK